MFTLPFTFSTLLILLAWQEKKRSKEEKETTKSSSLEEIQNKKINLMSSFTETSSVTFRENSTNCQAEITVPEIGPVSTLQNLP